MRRIEVLLDKLVVAPVPGGIAENKVAKVAYDNDKKKEAPRQ